MSLSELYIHVLIRCNHRHINLWISNHIMYKLSHKFHVYYSDNVASYTAELVIIALMAVILVAATAMLLRLKYKSKSRKITPAGPVERGVSALDIEANRDTQGKERLHSSSSIAAGESAQAGKKKKEVRHKPNKKGGPKESKKESLPKNEPQFAETKKIVRSGWKHL